MRSSSAIDQVREIAADVFQLPLEGVDDDASPDTVKGWDSLQYINLILALEQHFDIQFDPEEILKMVHLRGIASLIEDKQRHCRVGA